MTNDTPAPGNKNKLGSQIHQQDAIHEAETHVRGTPTANESIEKRVSDQVTAEALARKKLKDASKT